MQKREEFFITNHAKLPYEIEQIMLDLKGLRAMTIEHFRVCPNPSSELIFWFEKEVVRLPHSKTTDSMNYSYTTANRCWIIASRL